MAKTTKNRSVAYRQETYEYEAIAASGSRSKGKMQATSKEGVVNALQAAGYMPLQIKKVSSTNWSSDITALLGSKYQAKTYLSIEEQSKMFRQIAELLKAGVSVNYIIQALAEEAPAKMKPVYDGLLERLNAGVPFSEALGSFEGTFDRSSQAYIEAGEVAGTLGDTMNLLAKSMERRASVRSKIKGVTAYPKMVSMAIGSIVVLIMKMMVPKYAEIYADMKAELPAPTLALVKVSDNIMPFSSKFTFPTPFFVSSDVQWGIMAFPVRILFFVGLIMLTETMRSRAGKKSTTVKITLKVTILLMFTLFAGNYTTNPATLAVYAVFASLFFGYKYVVTSKTSSDTIAKIIDTIRFRIPIFGDLNRLTALHQWVTTMHGASSSGVTLAKSITLAGQTSGSLWYQSVSEKIRTSLLAGKSLHELMAETPYLFPPGLRAMVATGEMTGDLPTMFSNVAVTVENEIDERISGLSAKVEVALLLVMGVVVGGILVALYLPVVNMAAVQSEQGGFKFKKKYSK